MSPYLREPLAVIDDKSPADLFHRLKRLGMAGTVLHLAAHPDDEDVGLLAYVTFYHHGRAVYWSATRGEGGQNAVNAYSGKALGVFRTWESMTARRVSGGECLFGPFIDFGFSKNGKEALSKWGHDKMVREQVRAIRASQPQVVICRWAGTPEDLHGHHQAVGETMVEAFDAAGDPHKFPELETEGLYPWQPLKLYCSLNNDGPDMPAAAMGNVLGKSNPGFEAQGALRINTGKFIPWLGRTIQEAAWTGYNEHKTQGIGMLPAPGDFYYYLRLLKSSTQTPEREKDIFGGLDPTLPGLSAGAGVFSGQIPEALENVKVCVSRAVQLFHPNDPYPAVDPLLQGLSLLRALRSRLPEVNLCGHSRRTIRSAIDHKIGEFEKVIADCSGFRLEALCTRRKITPGESFWMSVRLWNHGRHPIDNKRVSIDLPQDWRIQMVSEGAGRPDGDPVIAQGEIFVGNHAELSCPFWLAEPQSEYAYSSHGAANSCQALGPGPIQVTCGIIVNGRELNLRTEGLHKMAFAGGYRQLAPIVIPPISLHPESDKKFFLVSNHSKRLSLKVTARCNDDEQPAEGHLRLRLPPGWKADPEGIDLHLEPGGACPCFFEVAIPDDISEGHHVLEYGIHCRGREYGVVLTPVRMAAPGLPDTDNASTCIREEMILAPAQVNVHIIGAVDLKNSRYAYVEGVREDILRVMESIGTDFTRLTDREIEHGDLNAFDAIVVGPKAYNLRQALRENAGRLLRYVENGGTLLVQFQWYGYDKKGLAPYPFKFHRPVDRVTDEKAKICLFDPKQRLFQFPNQIDEDDFNGWVMDRGLAFWRQWHENYDTYLSCSDPDEPPQDGGLVGCRYGKGVYLYVGYSLFRQLPAGVPGAFRLFFNLLSAGRGVQPC